MSTIFYRISVCLSVVVLAVSCDSMIPFEALPQESRTFILSNFQGASIPFAKKSISEYEVHLPDGSEIEFNRKGEWKKLDMEHSIIPESVMASLPAPINVYLETYFPGVPVDKLKKGWFGSYEIELANDVELKFASDGAFKSYDL